MHRTPWRGQSIAMWTLLKSDRTNVPGRGNQTSSVINRRPWLTYQCIPADPSVYLWKTNKTKICGKLIFKYLGEEEEHTKTIIKKHRQKCNYTSDQSKSMHCWSCLRSSTPLGQSKAKEEEVVRQGQLDGLLSARDTRPLNRLIPTQRGQATQYATLASQPPMEPHATSILTNSRHNPWDVCLSDEVEYILLCFETFWAMKEEMEVITQGRCHENYYGKNISDTESPQCDLQE